MRKLLLASAMVVLAPIGAAVAVPIAAGSGLNIQGVGNFTATQVNFVNPASVLPNGTTGDFTSFTSCVGCVTMTTPLTFIPFTPGQIYTGTSGAVSTSFTVDAETQAPVVTATTLTIHDSGTATLTGFDPTPGLWVFTMNQATGTIIGSFSATTVATPEPVSLGLLGMGLLGLGLVRRASTHRHG